MSPEPYKIYNRSLCLAGFKAEVERHGGNAEALVTSLDIPVEALHTPHVILPHAALLQALELAAERFDAPNFGLMMTVNGPEHCASLGPHLLLARLVDNIRDWFDLGISYWAYHTNSSTSTLIIEPEKGLATIRYLELTPGAMTPQYVDSCMSTMLKLGRVGSVQPDVSPRHLRLRREAPPDPSQHYEFYGCDIEFSAEYEEMVLDIETLEVPTKGGLSLFRSVADLYMQFAMARVSGQQRSLSISVGHAISTLLPTGTCSIDAVARVVGLSSKKLQRQLAAEGQTFSALLEEVRETSARELLLETKIPIEQIAGMLGYSSGVSFIIAFNRWTGMAPLRYRKMVQAAGKTPAESA